MFNALSYSFIFFGSFSNSFKLDQTKRRRAEFSQLNTYNEQKKYIEKIQPYKGVDILTKLDRRSVMDSSLNILVKYERSVLLVRKGNLRIDLVVVVEVVRDKSRGARQP
ncbi:hypothetical protein BpHYR1_038020 [Brachionus plicatilis]|uniref:Uncharacterized protein n=1 Tax=Brachionus plicatilis TaxID=10195 RepID=A0A3M7QPF0_BRAPC|nr:hypothetical protein BpHYR1_038020 [Brachionus plicatilis]